MFCKKCGKQIDDKTEFCPYCGSKQSDVVPQNSGMNQEGQPTNKPKVIDHIKQTKKAKNQSLALTILFIFDLVMMLIIALAPLNQNSVYALASISGAVILACLILLINVWCNCKSIKQTTNFNISWYTIGASIAFGSEVLLAILVLALVQQVSAAAILAIEIFSWAIDAFLAFVFLYGYIKISDSLSENPRN